MRTESTFAMKRLLAILLCLCLAVGLCACSAPAEDEVTSESIPVSQPESVVESEPEPEPEPLPPPPPPYLPNYLTGEEQSEDYNANARVTAVMVNNISACRPQRGLSQADILFESKVEGGITRFMALFQDYTKLEGDLGPVRSGRDQFLRLAIPFDAFYMHIGRSGITQTYIDQNEYWDRDVDGNSYNFIYRDTNRLNSGFALEHTAFTTAELLQEVFDKYEYNTERNYGEGATCFDFVDYAENGGEREIVGEDATAVRITHSYSYRTNFDYNEATGEYLMSQWHGGRGVWHDTVDENNGEQLSFENVLVLWADITTYPYPGGNLDANGNDKGDPNYQKLDLDYGSLGYYFANGKVEPIRWFKGATTDMLRFTDMDENPIDLNCGKTYIGFVDLDEYYNFSYSGPEVVVEEEVIESAGEEAEIGD